MCSSTIRFAALSSLIVGGAVFDSALAQAVVVQPRVTVGMQDYSFRYQDLVVPVNTNFSVGRDGFVVTDNVPFEGAGITVSRGRWFLDVGAQRTHTGETTTTQFIGPFPGLGLTGNGALHDLYVPFRRKEVNVAVGYGLNSNLTMFVGYKDASTELRNNLSPKLDQVQIGNIYLIGQQTNTFSYKGGFVGWTYSFPVERWGGAFGFQGSVARLDGRVEAEFDFPLVVSIPAPPYLQPVDPRVIGLTTTAPSRGKSTGVNLGLSWTGSFNWVTPKLRKLSYTIGVDRSEYSFEERSRTNDFAETITRVRLDLRYAIGIGREDAE
jgi:hypothetical protein